MWCGVFWGVGGSNLPVGIGLTDMKNLKGTAPLPCPFSVYGPVGMCRKEVQNVTLSNELLTFEIRDIRFINWQVKLSSGISMTFTSFLDIRIWWAY